MNPKSLNVSTASSPRDISFFFTRNLVRSASFLERGTVERAARITASMSGGLIRHVRKLIKYIFFAFFQYIIYFRKMLKLEQLKQFRACAELGSFAAAGVKLNISATTIAYSIDRLEERLQTKLFIRKKASGVKITNEGRVLLEKSRDLFEEMGDIEAYFTRSPESLTGEMMIGCQEGLSWCLLPRVFKTMSQDHPELQLRMKTTWMDDGFEPLDNGSVDLLVTYLVNEQILPPYSGTLIARPKIFAMMRKGHPLDNGSDKVSAKALAKYPQVMHADGPGYDLFYNVYKHQGLSPQAVGLHNISTTAQALVGLGDAVSLRVMRPNHNLSPLGDEIVFREIDEDQPVPDLVVVTLDSPFSLDKRKRDEFVKVSKKLFEDGTMRAHMFY